MYSVKNRPYFTFKNSKGIEYGVFFENPMKEYMDIQMGFAKI